MASQRTNRLVEVVDLLKIDRPSRCSFVSIAQRLSAVVCMCMAVLSFDVGGGSSLMWGRKQIVAVDAFASQ